MQNIKDYQFLHLKLDNLASFYIELGMLKHHRNIKGINNYIVLIVFIYYLIASHPDINKTRNIQKIAIEPLIIDYWPINVKQ